MGGRAKHNPDFGKIFGVWHYWVEASQFFFRNSHKRMQSIEGFTTIEWVLRKA
jgi:hypothetical protein